MISYYKLKVEDLIMIKLNYSEQSKNDVKTKVHDFIKGVHKCSSTYGFYKKKYFNRN